MNRIGLLAAALLVTACSGETGTEPAVTEATLTPPVWETETGMGQPRAMAMAKDHVLIITEQGNLMIDGHQQARGEFEGLDVRSGPDGTLQLVTLHTGSNQLVLFQWRQGELQEQQRLPAPEYAVNGFCLYRDTQSLLSVFLLDERGSADQWLLSGKAPQRLRHLVMPPEAEHCSVNDVTAHLYVSEEGVGLWRYRADPEQDPERELVDVLAPRGDIVASASGVAAIPGGVLLLDAQARQLSVYRTDGTAQQFAVPDLEEPERLAARVANGQLTAWVLDDGQQGVRRFTLPWEAADDVLPVIPTVLPTVETDAVARFGDAADDPAIWVHPSNPGASRILGTDKKAGLYVYDLAGHTTQFLPVGRLNNVDVRYGLRVNERLVDLAVASNRDHNSLHLFLIDRDSGELSDAGEIASGLEEIYGLCLYRDAQGVYAFANGKSGIIEQWLLTPTDRAITGERVRTLTVDSQPEGCVADDEHQRLFVGEEDHAVWVFHAGADQGVAAEQVIAKGENLEADIEGLSLYRRGDQEYLVISSQGNNSYVLVDAQPPYAYRGRFRIGMDPEAGIDGASETDGLAVTSADLGGAFSDGLLVVQDGRNRLPDAPQNFKLVPWHAIDATLGLSESR